MPIIDRIRDRKTRAAVIGLGYVGLPLAVEFARAGFDTIGIDIDPDKVDLVGQGQSYIADVASGLLSEVVDGGKLRATTDFSELDQVDTINICVPTPLRKTRDPDISYIVSVVEEIQEYLKPGQLIILESTTYPGTTEEVILPILQSDGLKVGEDFFVAFSPERVDPGNVDFPTRAIPKVVGGISPKCAEMARELYQATGMETVPVSSARVAETVKLLENTFRSVNIGLVNEIALMCNKMGIDVWEVIDAAATKPFGFMPFYPGPGLGGHCIPIDPFYLSWKARLSGFEARFIELAGQINGSMPEYVLSRVTEALNGSSKSVKGSRIMILGVSYKSNIDDIRESPALDLVGLLSQRGAEVVFHDNRVGNGHAELGHVRRVPLNSETLSGCDCVVIVTAHDDVDYDLVVEHAPLVVDTRNVLKNKQSDKIVKL